MRYFEDFSEGHEWDFGTFVMDHDEMVAFATEYDPQPIHIDDSFSEKTPFGGIIASGWLTTLKVVRRFVDEVMKDTAGLASPGLEELRWTKPVGAGDVLTARARVLSVSPSQSRPDRGRVHFEFYATDAQNDTIMTTNGYFVIARRPKVD